MYVQVVPVFVVLSFFGWILFVAGFGKEFKGYVVYMYAIMLHNTDVCYNELDSIMS